MERIKHCNMDAKELSVPGRLKGLSLAEKGPEAAVFRYLKKSSKGKTQKERKGWRLLAFSNDVLG